MSPPKTPQEYHDCVAKCGRLAANATYIPLRDWLRYASCRWQELADADEAGVDFCPQAIPHEGFRMTTARKLSIEARRLRELARTLDEDSEAWNAIQELIVELESRAHRLNDREGGDAVAPMHRRSLGELATDELRGRVRAYRSMASTATTADTAAALIRVAERLDRMVATRKAETLKFAPASGRTSGDSQLADT